MIDPKTQWRDKLLFMSFIRVINIIVPRPRCCWSQKRPQGQRGLSCYWCHSPALLHSRFPYGPWIRGWCRGWFAAPAGRVAPRALDIAQRTREHGCRDRRGERVAVAKADSGLLCYSTARRRSWQFMAFMAAAIKLACIPCESTHSYVYIFEAHSRCQQSCDLAKDFW